jgi:hemerythrin-like domain-containing protein
MTTDDLPLATRGGLPDALRVMLAEFPRAQWAAHRDFNGLAAFWLDRHLGFRRVMGLLQTDAQAIIDGRMGAQDWGRRLTRLGSGFLGELVGHHQIEDDAYFPKLAAMEPRILRGFEMLDRDHHDLHALIDRFAAGANHALAQTTDAARREAAGGFLTDLERFGRMLERHLTDEEDLIVPVVLKHRVG